jgi:hypothetical protein
MPEIEEPFEKWWAVGAVVVNCGNKYVVEEIENDRDDGHTDGVRLRICRFYDQTDKMGWHGISHFTPEAIDA